MNFLQISPINLMDARGRVVYLHNGVDIGSGAFSQNEVAEFLVEIPRYVAVSRAKIDFYSESGAFLYSSVP